MNNETIKRYDAIEAIKSLHNIIGDAGTKAAVMALDGIPAVSTGWISVKDRLPKPFITVIVHLPLESPLPTVGWGFIANDGTWHCNHYNRDKDEVTHWMPMPDAPKEE